MASPTGVGVGVAFPVTVIAVKRAMGPGVASAKRNVPGTISGVDIHPTPERGMRRPAVLAVVAPNDATAGH